MKRNLNKKQEPKAVHPRDLKQFLNLEMEWNKKEKNEEQKNANQTKLRC